MPPRDSGSSSRRCVVEALPRSGAMEVAPASWTAVALHRFPQHPTTSTPRRKRQRTGALQDAGATATQPMPSDPRRPASEGKNVTSEPPNRRRTLVLGRRSIRQPCRTEVLSRRTVGEARRTEVFHRRAVEATRRALRMACRAARHSIPTARRAIPTVRRLSPTVRRGFSRLRRPFQAARMPLAEPSPGGAAEPCPTAMNARPPCRRSAARLRPARNPRLTPWATLGRNSVASSGR